jgi:glycine hydroxymethyltransferase
VTSGIRLGTPALTTRGMREPEMRAVARLIHRTLASRGEGAVLREVHAAIAELTAGFPLYAERLASYAV